MPESELPQQTIPLKISVGSKNPSKIRAIESAFSKAFEIPIEVTGFEISSGVREQPLSEQETRKGAENRVKALFTLTDSDYYVACEGGIATEGSPPFGLAWIAIADRERQVRTSRTASYPIPPSFLSRLESGEELGSIIDSITATQDSKKKDGATGFLSRGVITRPSFYEHAITLCLCHWLHQELFF
jgi:inosine/xanthosine triphosphatase